MRKRGERRVPVVGLVPPAVFHAYRWICEGEPWRTKSAVAALLLEAGIRAVNAHGGSLVGAAGHEENPDRLRRLKRVSALADRLDVDHFEMVGRVVDIGARVLEHRNGMRCDLEKCSICDGSVKVARAESGLAEAPPHL